MLTVNDCAEFVRRRLDGEPSVPILVLCNQAGSYLIDCHKWNWLLRTSGVLNLVADSSRIVLPKDFGRLVGQPKASSGASVNSLCIGNYEDFLRYRSDYTGGGAEFRGSIVYGEDLDGNIAPRLEVWPVPTTSVQDAFRIAYLATWTRLEEDGSRVRIPEWLDSFFLQVLFAFAQAYDEHDLGGLPARLSDLLSGPEFLSLRQRDGSVQPFLGYSRGGAMEREFYNDMPSAVGIATRLLPPS